MEDDDIRLENMQFFKSRWMMLVRGSVSFVPSPPSDMVSEQENYELI